MAGPATPGSHRCQRRDDTPRDTVLQMLISRLVITTQRAIYAAEHALHLGKKLLSNEPPGFAEEQRQGLPSALAAPALQENRHSASAYDVGCRLSCLHDHSATASVQELRPSALRSELAYRALRVSDSSPLAGSGSLSKNFFSWQRGHAATWEQRTFESVTELSF
jgi:hypothetical protein